MTQRVWFFARQLALTLYTTCQTGTTGHGGYNEVRLRNTSAPVAHMDWTKIKVVVGSKLGKDVQGNWHKPVTLYAVPRGGGIPELWSASRLMDPRPEGPPSFAVS